MWYLDCYCYAASNGVDLPVNSYSDESPVTLAEAAARILGRKTSGIDEVRIAETTRGQNPVPLHRSNSIG